MKNTSLTITLLLLFLVCSCSSKQKLLDDYSNQLKEKLYDKSINYPQYEDTIAVLIHEEQFIFYYKYDSVSYEVRISDKYYSDFLPLFKKGILHPQLINSCFDETEMSVGQFKELPRTPDETKRAYRLWSWCKNRMNPCEYTIELSNKKADQSKSTKEFVENAKVTYISPCHVMI